VTAFPQLAPLDTAPTIGRSRRPSVVADLAAAARLADAALSPATLTAYARDWSQFLSYCGDDPWTLAESRYEEAVGAVCAFLGYLADRGAKASTMSRAVAGVRWGMSRHGRVDEPTRNGRVRLVLQGARREPERRSSGARAVGMAEVASMVSQLGDDPAGTRDRALILVSFAGAFRRSELIGLDVNDLIDDGNRITINLKRSKTDQEGRGRPVVVHRGRSAATCPVRALRRWLDVLGRRSGPLFVAVRKSGNLSTTRLSGEGVRLIIERAAAGTGLDEGVQPNGLRAGYVTEARSRGATAAQVRQVTGHSDERMIAHYTRHIDAIDNSGRFLGL